MPALQFHQWLSHRGRFVILFDLPRLFATDSVLIASSKPEPAFA